MKPVSIIFLIVSIALALTGLVTMRIAEGIGAREGIEIISETTESGDSVFLYDFAQDSIGKISLNVANADVNIIGGAEKPYIELINFADGLYEFSSANRMLTVSDRTDLKNIDGVAAFAMNFKGLRGLVNYVHVRGREKTVNIYLSDKYPVNIIYCSLDSGHIVAGGSSAKTDYEFVVGKGSVTINGIKTDSAVTLKIKDGSASLENCRVGIFTVEDSEKCPIEIVSSDIKSMNVETGEGDLRFGSNGSLMSVRLDLFTSVGSVRLDGEEKGGYYESQTPTNDVYKVTLGKGDIVMNSNMPVSDE